MQARTRPTLLERTLELLRETQESYLDIYKATGLRPSWLVQLNTGKIQDPSVRKIQALYEHLAQRELVA